MAQRRLSLVLDLDTGRYSGRLAQAGSQLRSFGGQVDNTSRSVRSFSDTFDRAGTRMGTPLQKLRDYVLVLGNLRLALLNTRDLAVGWVAGALKQSGEVERLTVLMRGLSRETTELGKNEEAKRNLAGLYDMARSTGFEINALADSFVKFRSAKLDPKEYSLRGLVDATAAFGGNSDVLHRASIAIQQMAGKGVISMEELRQQLGEAVPTAMEVMAHSAGKSVAEFSKEVAKGTVSAKPHLRAMLHDMEILYAGSGKRIANSLFGQVAQFRTNMTQLSTEFTGMGKSDGLFQGAVSSLKDLNAAMRSTEGRAFAVSLGRDVAGIASALASAAKFALEWHSQIGAALKGVLVVVAAITTRNIAGWTMQLGASAGQMASSWVNAFNQMRGATGNLATAVRGQASVFATAKSMELAAVRGNIAASERAVVVAREEAVAKMQAVGTTRAAESAAIVHARAKDAEVVKTQANIRAIEAERLAQIQAISAQRNRISASQAGIMFAQRDIDMLGTSKVRTDALGKAKVALMVEENKLAAMTAERVVIEDRLTVAVAENAVAENEAALAKRNSAQASRELAVADVEATAAVGTLAAAEGGAAAASGTLTVALRVQAVATQVAAAAAGFMRSALALLTNPLTMIAGGLLYAAYAAGVFEGKANSAAEAADRLRKSIGDLADAKKAAARLDEINSAVDDIDKNGGKMSVSGAVKERGWGGYLTKGVLVSPAEKAALLKEKADLEKSLEVGKGGAYSRGGEARYNESSRARRESMDSELSAKVNYLIQNEKLDERIENGDKSAVARRAAIMKAADQRRLAWDQTVVTQASANYAKAKASGNKEAAAYWAGILKPANEALKQSKGTLKSTEDAAVALGSKGGGGLDKFATKALNADAKTAGIEAKMRGAGKAMAEFETKLQGGMFKGMSEAQIGSLRRAAVATDALAASRKQAGADSSFESMLTSMTGQLAQLEDRLTDGKGTLAKFQAQLGASKDNLGLTPAQIKTLSDIAQHIDDTKQKLDIKGMMDDLTGELTKATTQADELWGSFNRGTMEADDRLAQIKARFADRLIGLSGADLANAKQKIDEIVAALQRADAAKTTQGWNESARDMRISLMDENAQREANFQRELERQQVILRGIEAETQARINNSALTAADRDRALAEQRAAQAAFLGWKAAAEARDRQASETRLVAQARAWSNMGANIQNVMTQALGSIVDGMVDADVNMGKLIVGIIKSLMKVILTAMVAYAIMSAVGMTHNSSGQNVSMGSFLKGQLSSGFSASGNQNSEVGIGYGAGGATVPVKHNGGVIGAGGTMTTVAANLFAGAQTRHNGGWIGGRQLKPGEVPLIGLDDEVILNRDQQKLLGKGMMGGGAAPNVQVNVINNSGTELETEHGEPEINGKDMIVQIVVEAAQKQGKLRDVLSAMGK